MRTGPQIRVVWRAEFEGPKGTLNPLGLKVPGPIEVELAKVGASWIARRPGTRGAEFLFPITKQPSADALKSQITLWWFEKQVTEWQAFKVDGDWVVRLAVGQFWEDEGKYREAQA